MATEDKNGHWESEDESCEKCRKGVCVCEVFCTHLSHRRRMLWLSNSPTHSNTTHIYTPLHHIWLLSTLRDTILAKHKGLRFRVKRSRKRDLFLESSGQRCLFVLQDGCKLATTSLIMAQQSTTFFKSFKLDLNRKLYADPGGLFLQWKLKSIIKLANIDLIN